MLARKDTHPKRPTIIDRLLARWVRKRLATVDIAFNGEGSCVMRVPDITVLRRVVTGDSLDLLEGYQRGDWDCDDLVEFCARIRRMRPTPFMVLAATPTYLKNKLVNLQTRVRAKRAISRHYDMGNDFYKRMLDPEYLQYSCAYFERGATTLAEAQLAKLRLLCRKLQLKRGMRVLDIGCGWGGLAKFMAKEYGVTVVGITLSEEQAVEARERCKGLAVEIHVMDYRDAPNELGQFDRLVSVGMFDHVDEKNHRSFFRAAYACLKDGGLFVLHTIVGTGRPDRWIQKYIFPDGVLPKYSQLRTAFKGFFFDWDVHEFGQSYAKTLLCWRDNFKAAWQEIKNDPPFIPYGPSRGTSEYAEWFFRTWVCYSSACSGSFKGGHIRLKQLVLAKRPRPQRYEPVR